MKLAASSSSDAADGGRRRLDYGSRYDSYGSQFETVADGCWCSRAQTDSGTGADSSSSCDDSSWWQTLSSQLLGTRLST